MFNDFQAMLLLLGVFITSIYSPHLLKSLIHAGIGSSPKQGVYVGIGIVAIVQYFIF